MQYELNGAATFSMTTVCRKTSGIKAESYKIFHIFIVVPSAFMSSVIMLIVFMLSLVISLVWFNV